jgi:hypothetical protein
MSSAPSGLDVREYAYGYYSAVLADGAGHTISALGRWLVTKIQIFADATHDVDFVLEVPTAGGGGSPDVIIRAGGCLVLEPNGSFRGRIDISGQGAQIIVEYWWQPDRAGGFPTVVFT